MFCIRDTGSILCQQKGRSDNSVTVRTYENHGHIVNQVLESSERNLRRISAKRGLGECLKMYVDFCTEFRLHITAVIVDMFWLCCTKIQLFA